VTQERDRSGEALREAERATARTKHDLTAASGRAEAAEARCVAAQRDAGEALEATLAAQGLVRKLASELALPLDESAAALAGDGSSLEAALLAAHEYSERAAADGRAAAVRSAVGRVREAEVVPLRAELASAQAEGVAAAAAAAEAQLALKGARAEANRLATELNGAEVLPPSSFSLSLPLPLSIHIHIHIPTHIPTHTHTHTRTHAHTHTHTYIYIYIYVYIYIYIYIYI